jgi:hypothetical protein
MKWFRRISIAVPLLGVYGGYFCYFFAPSVLIWLFIAAFLFLIPLACHSIQALWYRNWRLSSVFALTWLLLIVPLTDLQVPREWLKILGFYAKTRLVSDYPSKCRLSDFVENGVTQTAGVCEEINREDYFEYVIYDTTGEFVLPAAERKPEWKRMMSVKIKDAPVDNDRTAYHLFGHYYAVVLSLADLTG